MPMKKIATVLTAMAVMASGPALAQATAPAAPVPASENALKGSAQMGEGNTTAAYVLAAIVGAALIYGLVEFIDDDDGGAPVSP